MREEKRYHFFICCKLRRNMIARIPCISNEPIFKFTSSNAFTVFQQVVMAFDASNIGFVGLSYITRQFSNQASDQDNSLGIDLRPCSLCKHSAV